MLDRLTYANVVATLALFIALGGSAYAVTQIGSKQVKNRSLKGVDLRRNTIGGAEVRESKLRRVPRAALADQAIDATNADNAANATNSALAGLATNAEQLGGQGPGFFEKSSRIQFTSGTSAPANPQSAETAFEWDALGLVATVPAQGGCPDPPELTLRIRNNRQSGPPLLLTREDGTLSSIPPNETVFHCSGRRGRWTGAARNAGEDPTLFFDCQKFTDEFACLSIRSVP